MNKQDEKLLNENGFEVECHSPFEIRYKKDTESFASGLCAELILIYFKEGIANGQIR